MNGNRIIQLLFYFVLLILVEVFIVNKLQLSIYIVPHVFYLFVLLLPTKTSKIGVLLISFVLGLLIDLFLHTNGVHTAVVVFIGLLRNFLMPYFVSVDQMANDVIPSYQTMGWKKNIIYVSVMTFIYQLILQSLSFFKLSAMPLVLIKALVSTVLSVFLILVLEIVLLSRQKK